MVVANAGPAEAEIRPRGAWLTSASYVLNDVVTFRGSAFRALRASQGKIPGSTSPSTAADWQVFVAGFGPLGAWGSTITYNKNDLVLYLGSTWRALRTSLGKTPGRNASDWQLFAAKGDKGSKGDKGATGARGPQGIPGSTAVADGSTAAPAFKFTSSSDTGIFSPGGGKLALAENGTLLLHDIGSFNLGLGFGALGSSTGSSNTALGFSALSSNSTGNANTAVGGLAMQANTTGSRNAALGDLALNSNEAGNDNTAVGYQALLVNTASGNSAFGRDALLSNTTGFKNLAVGNNALSKNSTGDFNTAIGNEALASNQTSSFNTAFGIEALQRLTSGKDNTALGRQALREMATASSNTAIGNGALSASTTGSSNIAIGASAAINPTGPSDSIFIGNAGLAADTATIKIGTQGTQNTTFIAGIFGAGTSGGVGVQIDSTGKLGTTASSRRYKEDIQPMAAMSDMLAALRPVSFRYKKPFADGSKPIQYGLIAEDVVEVFPYLAVFNKEGQPETVRYQELPTFLLEGFQEQQKIIAAQAEKIARQQAINDAQAERMAALEQRLLSIEAQLDRSSITTASDSR
jgi:hypothetical protein